MDIGKGEGDEMEHEMRRYIGETDGDREEGGRIEIQNTSLGLQKNGALNCRVSSPLRRPPIQQSL